MYISRSKQRIFKSLSLFLLSTIIVSNISYNYFLRSNNYISRRAKTSSFSIQSLLGSELSSQEVQNRTINHLWQSWDEIISNLQYITDNFQELYKQTPEVIDAFLTSLIVDIRALITPSLFSDVDSIYHNLDKLSELWSIEDKLAQILLFLDKYSEEGVYFTRFLINSLFRLMPGRIDVEMFKKLYEESNARGRVEIKYTAKRDWSAARHGVTIMSRIVSPQELDATIKSLEDEGFVIYEIIQVKNPTASKLHPEFQHLSTKEIDTKLTVMTNIIQRPFRIDTSTMDINILMDVCYEWWKSQVGEEIASNFKKTIGYRHTSWFAYLGTHYKKIIEKLTFMREILAKIIYSENTSNNVKTATIIFDKYLSSMLKNTAMKLVDSYQKPAEKKDDRKGYAFPRFHSASEKQNPEKKYWEIISTINLLLKSLILDRNVPHRLWRHDLKGKVSYIEINPYDKNWKLDYKKLYDEISYLENVLNEIVKAMHGETFEPGRNLIHPYQKWISQKFDTFSLQYNQIVQEYPAIFPDLSTLKLHVIDTPVALSLLRQIEFCKDALKSLFEKEHPEFFHIQIFLDLLRKIKTEAINYYYPTKPLEFKFSKATPELAQESDGLLVTSIMPHPYDPFKVILVTVKDCGDSSRVYHIITNKDNLPLRRTVFPDVEARYSNGINFLPGIYQTVVYSPYLKPEEVQGKIVFASTPDPNIITLFYVKIGGIICETGGVTTHLMNVAREQNIPGLAAMDVKLSQLLLPGMPVYVEGNKIYFLLYSYTEGDTAYIASGE